MEVGGVEYEARRRRSSWSDSVRRDAEIKALDEVNGEWILCATCAAHFQRTGRGRRPNDPLGFKVKMNGRFQEAAWVVHKNRVVAHRLGVIHGTGKKRRSTENDGVGVIQEVGDARAAGVDRHGANDSSDEGLSSMLMDDYPTTNLLQYATANQHAESDVRIPLGAWKCPGVVPNEFYQANSDLVHAFAKYYVGSYRINAVRDIRTDRVLLFSHECENEAVQRTRLLHSLACNSCHAVWTHHKSFRRILKKMERYNHVEALLRRAWSLSGADLETLSRFKHASASNLNIEGRKLKQAVIDVLRHYGTPRPIREEVALSSAAGEEQHLTLSHSGAGPLNNHLEGSAAIADIEVSSATEHYRDATANI